MKARWDAFGWDTHDGDGHDPAAIAAEVRSLQAHKEAPHVLIVHTVFGKGVPFMEGQIPWHYFPMNDEQYQVALESVEQGE
jgi:transketolase